MIKINIPYYYSTKNNWKSMKPFKNSIELNCVATITEFDGKYTMSLLEQNMGGPIMFDTDIDALKTKFNDALSMCFAVNNLMLYVK